MTTALENPTRLAEILAEAYLQGHDLTRLTADPALEKLSIHDAYRIQSELRRLLERQGHRVIGYKMGLTSKAKMRQMGVHSPIYGFLTDRMQLSNGQALPSRPRIHPRIEPEVAFVIGPAIEKLRLPAAGSPIPPELALSGCSGVCAAMEIIDSRYRDFQFTLPDVIADNCSSSEFVLGEQHAPGDLESLSNLGMIMELTDPGPATRREFGSSAAIYGHPAASLAELLRLLGEAGLKLNPGDVVLAGAATQALALNPGTRAMTTVETLGKAVLECPAA